MSASLVGSEMCIRDSAENPPLRTLRCRPKSAGDVFLRTDTKGSPQSPYSVSYTHLTLPTICSV
eukprot:13955117-Alexandrium_andersonii.AAC.1